jgi:hypothetical protein
VNSKFIPRLADASFSPNNYFPDGMPSWMVGLFRSLAGTGRFSQSMFHPETMVCVFSSILLGLKRAVGSVSPRSSRCCG